MMEEGNKLGFMGMCCAFGGFLSSKDAVMVRWKVGLDGFWGRDRINPAYRTISLRGTGGRIHPWESGRGSAVSVIDRPEGRGDRGREYATLRKDVHLKKPLDYS